MRKLWAITLAVPHEISALLKSMTVRAETQAKGIRLWEGALGDTDVILAQTGVGWKRAEGAAEFLFDSYPISHFLSTGYCGGLKEGIGCAQAVVAEKLQIRSTHDTGRPHGVAPTLSGDPRLSAFACRILKDKKILYHQGDMVSSETAVLKTPDKEKLGVSTGAIAVDMESYPLVRLALAKKIASVTVRFVVDAFQDELTDTEPFLDEEARVKPFRLVREMIRRPKILLELPGLERKASQARAAMASFCEGFFGEKNREIS